MSCRLDGSLGTTKRIRARAGEDLSARRAVGFAAVRRGAQSPTATPLQVERCHWPFRHHSMLPYWRV